MFTGNLASMNLRAQDVVNLPAPALTPIAYLNSGLAASQNAKVVQIGLNLHFAPGVATFNAASSNLICNDLTVSNGDEQGVANGVISSLIVAEGRNVLGSAKLLNGLAPSSNLAQLNGQNAVPDNVPGVNVMPSNATVVVMA